MIFGGDTAAIAGAVAARRRAGARRIADRRAEASRRYDAWIAETASPIMIGAIGGVGGLMIGAFAGPGRASTFGAIGAVSGYIGRRYGIL